MTLLETIQFACSFSKPTPPVPLSIKIAFILFFGSGPFVALIIALLTLMIP